MPHWGSHNLAGFAINEDAFLISKNSLTSDFRGSGVHRLLVAPRRRSLLAQGVIPAGSRQKSLSGFRRLVNLAQLGLDHVHSCR
jgi:hypothetical protein